MTYVQYTTHPILRDPVFIVAFGGWNDAADAATTTIKFLRDKWKPTRFADIDSEEFFVYTETRPTAKFVEAQQRTIVWPSNQFYAHVEPGLGHDIVLVQGAEPQLKWKTFSTAFLEVCQLLQASEVIFLGALLADIPHTSPVPITGTATTPELVERLRAINIRQSRYEGPTGIVGVLQNACEQAGIPAASLWGAAPHYLAASPNIKVTSALLTALNTFLSLGLNLQDIQTDAIRFEDQISRLVARDPDASAYVRRLEEQFVSLDEEDEEGDDSDIDANDDTSPNPDIVPGTGPLPSADTLIRGVEELLRQQRERGSQQFTDDEDDE
jgi:proteasome assembly chaperone (PAC2) family protein